jgi:hypothetical protein
VWAPRVPPLLARGAVAAVAQADRAPAERQARRLPQLLETAVEAAVHPMAAQLERLALVPQVVPVAQHQRLPAVAAGVLEEVLAGSMELMPPLLLRPE